MTKTAEQLAPPEAPDAIEVIVDDEARGWASRAEMGGAPLDAFVASAARAALAEAGAPEPAAWSVCVLLCGDARIAELNGRFRGAAQPTNVLSWPAVGRAAPMTAADWGALESDAADLAPLGDVALAWETTAREAEGLGRPLEAHVALLIVHGVLHLCGYRHDDDPAAEAMEAAEARALARIGIAL